MIQALLLLSLSDLSVERVYTSTDTVTSMVARENDLIVGTRGGLIRITNNRIDKYTVEHGLPSNEILGLQGTSRLVMRTPLGESELIIQDLVGSSPMVVTKAQTSGNPNPETIVATVHFGGKKYVGTRNAGLFRYSDARWEKIFSPHSELRNHNAQHIFVDKSGVLVSSLDGGLWSKHSDDPGWGVFETHHNAIKEAVRTNDGTIYARLGTGRIDVITRKAITKLEVDHASSLGLTPSGVAVGFRGGFLHLLADQNRVVYRPPSLKDVSVTCTALLPDQTWLVGTQTHGLARLDAKTSKFTWIDQGLHLQDDWITVIKPLPDSRVFVGTFTGGAYVLTSNERLHYLGLKNVHVTGATIVNKTLIVGSRAGLFELKDNVLNPSTISRCGNEVQGIASFGRELWIGTRTGVYSVETELTLP